MSNNPKISVIMNCYNSAKYLKEAINSVYAQTFHDWEIIFWDNASTDDSPNIVRAYDDKISYFRSGQTTSLGEARNLAIGKARGEFIAFLDCDDKWLPDKLQKQVDIFTRSPETTFIYTNYYLFNEESKKTKVIHKKECPRGNIFEQALFAYQVGLLTVMVKKSALDKLETLFDVNLNLAEEYDVFMRLFYNAKVEYLHEPLAVYRVHSEMSTLKHNDKFSDERLYCLEKFKKIDRSVGMRYKDALNNIEAKIRYNKGLVELEKTAMLLKEYRFKTPYAFCVYLLSRSYLFVNFMCTRINNIITGSAYFNSRKIK